MKVFKQTGRHGKKLACYYGKVSIGPGRWKRYRLFTDRTASERRLRELQSEVDQRAAGVRTAVTDSAVRPIAEHVADYLASLKLKTASTDHHAISAGVLDRLVKAAGWKFIRDMTVESVERVLSDLAKTESYRNVYIKRAKAFGNWLEDQGRVSVHPLRKLHRVSEKNATRNRARRAATPEESAKLFALKLPHERRLAYALARFNGLRRNEARDLTWERVHLNAPIPFVELPQKNGTDGNLDSVPLHPYVVKLLKQDMEAMPGVRVLRSVPDVKTIKKDWETRADVAFVSTSGKRLDYHAFRHTFQTDLDRTGCSRATKKRLMRHAAEDVTDGYAHAELSDMYTALCKIPSPDTLSTQVALQTGSDGPKRGIGTGFVGPQVRPNFGQLRSVSVSQSENGKGANLSSDQRGKNHHFELKPIVFSFCRSSSANDLIETSMSTTVSGPWPDTQVD